MTVGGKWMKQPVDPYNPLGLPPFTIRCKFTEGFTPTFNYGTKTQVSSSPNIWDLTYENTDWELLFSNQSDLIEVIGANTTGVTNMQVMFQDCWSLTTVSLFDTSNVTNMFGMFSSCNTLTSVPLFDTSNVRNMSYMFTNCYEVQSGALALYQQASSQYVPPSSHTRTFTNCGTYTTTGAAELAQIPSDWGGTLS